MIMEIFKIYLVHVLALADAHRGPDACSSSSNSSSSTSSSTSSSIVVCLS